METMTIDELNRLTAHPEELSRHTLSPLAELVETYPYAQSIVMLYLLNLSILGDLRYDCLLYTSPSPRDKRQSRMPSSA